MCQKLNKNKGVAGGLGKVPPIDFTRLSASSPNPNLVEEVRDIAAAVRLIGRGRVASPEAMLIEKHEAADRLLALAARMEGA